jgi:hypothetical protein
MAKNPVDFTDQEIEERLDIWTALSEIFVNVEQTQEEFDQHLDIIARNVAPMGYPLESLKNIIVNEIGPFFIKNFSILNPLPQTDFWTREQVETIMKQFRAQRNTLDGRVQRLFMTDPLKNSTVSRRWKALHERLTKLGVTQT